MIGGDTYFLLKWKDHKLQTVVLPYYTEDEAMLALVEEDLIKVGFLENRPLSPLGRPIPLWLDIDPHNIITVNKVELYS